MYICLRSIRQDGCIAQWLERTPDKREVGRSIPPIPKHTYNTLCDVCFLYLETVCNFGTYQKTLHMYVSREKGLEPPALSFGNLRSTNRTPLPYCTHT